MTEIATMGHSVPDSDDAASFAVLLAVLARVKAGDFTARLPPDWVGAAGKVADGINEFLVGNEVFAAELARQNLERDWLKTHREQFTRMLLGQRELDALCNMILSELAPLVAAQHGVFYVMDESVGEPCLRLQAGYGYQERKHPRASFRIGEGLVGQCAKEKKAILLTDVPDDYVRINSGLGSSRPRSIIVVPVLFEGSVRAVFELASFSRFTPIHRALLDQLTESIGLALGTIEAARLLEERASQLAVSSKYKSEFIANMSHELRTPLNSLLMLAEHLESNPGHTMTDAQVEYASIIRASGNDLLTLLNDVLDLAKVESGTVSIDLATSSVRKIGHALLREFEQVAKAKNLGYSLDLSPDCPPDIITDPDRLRQVLKNLITNAFKFTHNGNVALKVWMPTGGWSTDVESLVNASSVVAFSVIDTGIGLDEAQQSAVFEEFAQGDGSTARLYGGTGLGLSISRKLVRLLGGEIRVNSDPRQGSNFTVYVPVGSLQATGAPVRSALRPAPPARQNAEVAGPPTTQGFELHPTGASGRLRRPRIRAAGCR